MISIVLRVRLVGGGQTDVEYDGPPGADERAVVDKIVSTLGKDGGVLRCRHGDRMVALYSRGVATVEVAPRGAIL